MERAAKSLTQWLHERFRRQVPVGPFVLDFYCAELALAIEVDGAHHSRSDVVEYDDDRTAYLNARGIEVFRIENALLAKDAKTVEEQLRSAIEGRVAKRTS